MYNDHASHEEVRELLKQRTQEAEAYSRQKQLGYGDSRLARWVFLLIVLIAALVVVLLF